MRFTFAVLVCAVLACGCGKEDSGGGGTTGGGGSGTSAPKADYSSPKACVESMFAACKANDAAGMKAAFATECEGEFKSMMANASESEQFMKEFATGTVTGEAAAKEDGKVMSVPVSWKRGEREKKNNIDCVKEGDVWKIRGF